MENLILQDDIILLNVCIKSGSFNFSNAFTSGDARTQYKKWLTSQGDQYTMRAITLNRRMTTILYGSGYINVLVAKTSNGLA